MIRYYNEQRLGETVTYHQEDIPGDLSLDEWDTIENIQGRNNLLVCIGDSWTWGDSITENLSEYNLTDPCLSDTDWDKDQRRQLCYGAHLSNLLDADWLNYGFPGYSNIYILERFAKALKDLPLHGYQNVYFVLCLTETGREWAWQPVPDPETTKGVETDDFCAESEQYIIDKILEVYGDRDLNKLIICRNFTKSYLSTHYHTDYLKPWIQVNWEHEQVDIELGGLLMEGPATKMGIEPINFLETYEEYTERKHFHLDILYKFLETSKFHHHKATKHPTAESHKLWAEYLHQSFQRGTLIHE